MPQSSHLTNSGTENLSRKDLLKWVNNYTSANYKKIEELCSGVAYCQIMELVFPGTVVLKRVKNYAKFELDYIHNLRLLQNALKKANIERGVPIERMIKGKFQDNFEFLQWFKKIIDLNSSQSGERKNKAAALPHVQPTPSSSSGKNTEKIQTNYGLIVSTPAFFKDVPKRRSLQSTPKSSKLLEFDVNKDGLKSPLTLEFLSKHADKFKTAIRICESERDYYYTKLKQIDLVIEKEEAKGVLTHFSKKVKDVLYCPENNNDKF